jgi:soluble lytic murein transglycosylase-like protein/tetratricopeptide (TPR) repeat protein
LSVVGIALLAFACGQAPAPVAAPPLPPVVVAPPAPVDPIASPRDLAKLGLSQFDQKLWNDAAATLAKAATADPLAAPWLQLRQVEAEAQQQHFARAAEIANQIIASAPESGAATTARLRLPALYARAGDSAATDTAFRQALQVPIDETTEGDFVQLASSLDSGTSSADAGAGAPLRHDLATQIRLRLLTDYPQGRFTEQTYGKLANASPSPLDALPLDASMTLAQHLAANDRYDQEFDLLDRLAKRFPESQANALYHVTRIRALFHSRRYTELLAETTGEKFTEPSLALLHARAAWRAGRNDEFLAELASVEHTWPASTTAAEAKILRSKFYTSDAPDYGKAIDNLRAALALNDPGTDGENLWTLGWTLFLAGHPDEALHTLDDYLRQFPDADYTSNALFWSGKILDKFGRAAERDAKWRTLINQYPYGYFSYRARELSGCRTAGSPGCLGDSSATGQPTASFPDIDAQIALANEPRVDVVRELEAIGLLRDAAAEMKRVASAHPDNLGLQFLLADLYVEGGEPFKANGILQRRFRDFVRHGGTNIPQRFWEILYPLKYWDAYQAAAAKQNVDPYVLVAITRQESGFEPSTVSNAGAVGLMQIMPAEAGAIATRAALPPPTREQLFEPATNIDVGAAEFAQKVAAMHGNLTLAIAAYNAGEDAVARWIALTPADDTDLFVEAIPYAETRLYVKTVTRNRFEYRRIYEGSGRKLEPSP